VQFEAVRHILRDEDAFTIIAVSNLGPQGVGRQVECHSIPETEEKRSSATPRTGASSRSRDASTSCVFEIN